MVTASTASSGKTYQKEVPITSLTTTPSAIARTNWQGRRLSLHPQRDETQPHGTFDMQARATSLRALIAALVELGNGEEVVAAAARYRAALLSLQMIRSR